LFWIGKLPPVKHKDVKACLIRLGFEKRKTKGTSHEHYVAHINGKFHKVTLDGHLSPYSINLIKSMANQAGFSNHREFVSYCVDKQFKSKNHPLENKKR